MELDSDIEFFTSVREDIIFDIDIVVYMIVVLGGSFMLLDIDYVFVDSVVDEMIILVNFDIEVEEEVLGGWGFVILELIMYMEEDCGWLNILKGLKE